MRANTRKKACALGENLFAEGLMAIEVIAEKQRMPGTHSLSPGLQPPGGGVAFTVLFLLGCMSQP